MQVILHLPLVTTTWENEFESLGLEGLFQTFPACYFEPLSVRAPPAGPPLSLIADGTWKALLTLGAQTSWMQKQRSLPPVKHGSDGEDMGPAPPVSSRPSPPSWPEHNAYHTHSQGKKLVSTLGSKTCLSPFPTRQGSQGQSQEMLVTPSQQKN